MSVVQKQRLQREGLGLGPGGQLAEGSRSRTPGHRPPSARPHTAGPAPLSWPAQDRPAADPTEVDHRGAARPPGRLSARDYEARHASLWPRGACRER